MSRLIAFLLLFFTFPVLARANTGRFAGAWSVDWCPSDKNPDYCGGFNLYLAQRGDHVYGTHTAATPGLGRLDEGDECSVDGIAKGNTALLTITSGRDGSVFRARATRIGPRLKWEMLELKEGSGNDAVIAEDEMLEVKEAPEQLNRIASQCVP